MRQTLLCPALSPNSSEPPDLDDEDGGVPTEDDVGTADDDAELGQMEEALELGNGYDKGANLGSGTLCGPDDDGGSGAQKPVSLRGPSEPSQAEVDLHNLTHLPYRSWCPHCVATRRPNVAHRTSKTESTLPLLVMDYCYVRDAVDQDLTTVLVARVFPYRMTFAMSVDVKGRDESAIQRLAQFIKTCGLTQFSYRCDQEPSLLALVDEAILLSGRNGQAEGKNIVATPELSSVGESQSNGRSERGVQLVEDLIRTLKSAFEARLNLRLGSTHPAMKWLVEYASVLLSKYAVGEDGRTAYQRLHGRQAQERLVEFGEKVLFFIPKARRAKLDKRFGLGVYLGRALWGDENYIARADGSVIRSRGLARLSPKLRWDARWFEAIKGTPNEMMTTHDAAEVEASNAPHAQAYSELDKKTTEDPGTESKAPNSMRLTKEICTQYGFSKNCPRCRYYQTGRSTLSKSNHTPACRARLYDAMRKAGDKKLRPDLKDKESEKTVESGSRSV